MPTKAWKVFCRSLEDIDYFLGRKSKAGRIAIADKRAAITALHTAIEIYVEDALVEAAKYILDYCSLNKIPKAWKAKVVELIKQEKDEQYMFQLAGDGWKGIFEKAVRRPVERNNSIASEKINRLAGVIGISDIVKDASSRMQRDKSIAVSSVEPFTENYLDGLSEIRGEIVHKRKKPRFNKGGIICMRDISKEICRSLDNSMLHHVLGSTGKTCGYIKWRSVGPKLEISPDHIRFVSSFAAP